MSLFHLGVTFTFTLFLVTVLTADDFKKPPNFPDSINLTLTDFRNWAEDIFVKNVWTMEPKNVTEIIQVANWARQNGYQVRPSGQMRTWSPVTLVTSTSSEPPPVILVKMAPNMNQINIISNEPGRSSFWAEAGITLDKLLENLESRNLELINIPSMGNVTLGGVLATGGHGSGVPSKNDTTNNTPDRRPYSSLSNLIISLTAIVYSKENNSYIVKEFRRQDDPLMTAALLINLGRLIITNVTMKARTLSYLRCKSIVNIRPEILMAHPNPDFATNPSADPSKSLAALVNSSGTVEVIMYPFTDRPWIKKWTPLTREECHSTRESTEVNEPYNYPFLDNYPKSVRKVAGDIQNGSYQRAEVLGPLLIDVVVESLELSQSQDMCGPSKNTLLNVQPSSLKYSAGGWAILTRRVDVQRVIYETHQYYRYLLYDFASKGKYPLNGPISYKITNVEDPTESAVNGAENPILSPASSPSVSSEKESSKENKIVKDDVLFDTVVWFDLYYFKKTPHTRIFLDQMEKYFLDIFNGDWALMRGDLTKGWDYSIGEEPWSLLTDLEGGQGKSNISMTKIAGALKTLDAFDPFQVFSNTYLKQVLKTRENMNFCIRKEDGKYINPVNCATFYYCSNRSTQLIPCPAPLHFSVQEQLCAMPEDAGCQGGSFYPEFDFLQLTTFLKKYKNWSGEILLRNVWRMYPRNGQDVVEAANWARQYNFRLRPTGYRHTWAPITVSKGDYPGFILNELEPDPELPPAINRILPQEKSSSPPSSTTRKKLPKPGMILLDTRLGLNKMGIISSNKDNATFWTEPGIKMETLLTALESEGLSLLSHPAPGELTLGGVLAIGGHGSGMDSPNEKKLPGHSYGSLSNLVVAFTAVVFDKEQDQYVLKNFNRSDPEAKAFLVSLGRTFITNITMRAGPLHYLRCFSTTRVLASELFAPPGTPGNNSFAQILQRTGRAEAVIFPFMEVPWLKIWQVVDKATMEKRSHGILDYVLPFVDRSGDMGISRRVKSPYNYPFSDFVPEQVLQPIKAVGKCPDRRCSQLAFKGLLAVVQAGLLASAASDIWGESKNLFLYLRPTTMKVTANGYAVITSSENIQRAVYEVYTLYNTLMESYADRGVYPINCALEMRMTSIERPEESGVKGAEPPALSAISPVEDQPTWDTGIWINMLSIPGTEHASDFYREFEVAAYKIFNGEWATIRIEWSKGWGYEFGQAYASEEFKKNIAKGFPKGIWNFTVNTLTKYDPHGVFSNDFLNKLLVPR